MHPFIETVRFLYTKDIIKIQDDFVCLFWEGISEQEYGSTSFFCLGDDDDFISVRFAIKVRYPLNEKWSELYLQYLQYRLSFCNIDLCFIDSDTIGVEFLLNSDDIENFKSWDDSHLYIDNMLHRFTSLLQTVCLTIHVTHQAEDRYDPDGCDQFLPARLADLSVYGFIGDYTAH